MPHALRAPGSITMMRNLIVCLLHFVYSSLATVIDRLRFLGFLHRTLMTAATEALLLYQPIIANFIRLESQL